MAKKGVNTTEQQMRAVQNSGKVHDWPPEAGNCTGSDWSMYAKSQAQRSHDDWSPLDLISLANLSKMQADLVAEHDRLRAEGSITFGGKTGLVKIQNPRARVVHDLASSINSLARRLGLTSMSVNEKRSQAARGSQERKAASTLGDTTDDPLGSLIN